MIAPLAHAAAFAARQHLHWNLGDLPTWLLAALALGALLAAIAAYKKQTATYDDQRKANEKQARVLDAQVREISRREATVIRQQADAVLTTPGRWTGRVPGVRQRDDYDKPVHMLLVTNDSRRPIRNVVCRLQTEHNGVMFSACLVARQGEMVEVTITGQREFLYHDISEDTKVRVIRPGQTWAFVFVYDVASHQGIFTARFDDDPHLRWQIDDDGSLIGIMERDW